MSEPQRQHLTLEFGGKTIIVPIHLTEITARDLKLQERAIMNAAEDAWSEYLYQNRWGRFANVPESDHQKSSPAAPAAKKNSRKK